MPSHRGKLFAVLLACAAFVGTLAPTCAQEQNWTHFVRIGAYGLRSDNADAIVRDATKTHVFGIEVDNDIPGRYESYLDPTAKLAAIRTVAQRAHAAGNKSFVYIAGTECITANADKAAHSVMKDHPDWVQRKITGEPALFAGGAAFWIRKGDEDVWISPYAEPWRHTYMERVRQIAATGIDGIYVDIPYWMTHFDGWENTWASFDDFTVAAFKHQAGLDARKDLKLGDFSDPNFRKWIIFRIDTLTNFVREIRETARSVNPGIMIIPEIYPGIEQEAVRVGSDVYEMYSVVDVIAHEYEFGDGDHMASERSTLNWFLYQAGMLTFRAFAQGKATWILNYSWDGDKAVAAPEAMKTLAASQIVDGANFWDAPGHSMAGSNDPATRSQIFAWISQHERTFYLPRTPIHPIGVYFSPSSRNFDSNRFLASYRGTLVLLLQNHLEFQVVTPRTLSEFRGNTLIFPDVSELNDSERQSLQAFVTRDGRLVVAGAEAPNLPHSEKTIRFAASPGAAHLKALEEDFAAASNHMPTDFLNALAPNQDLTITASPFIASNVAQVNGRTHIFLANFAGIVPHHNVKPTADTSVRLTVPASCNCVLHFLPFLGEERTVPSSSVEGKQVFSLPAFDRAAAAWLEPNK